MSDDASAGSLEAAPGRDTWPAVGAAMPAHPGAPAASAVGTLVDGSVRVVVVARSTYAGHATAEAERAVAVALQSARTMLGATGRDLDATQQAIGRGILNRWRHGRPADLSPTPEGQGTSVTVVLASGGGGRLTAFGDGYAAALAADGRVLALDPPAAHHDSRATERGRRTSRRGSGRSEFADPGRPTQPLPSVASLDADQPPPSAAGTPATAGREPALDGVTDEAFAEPTGLDHPEAAARVRHRRISSTERARLLWASAGPVPLGETPEVAWQAALADIADRLARHDAAPEPTGALPEASADGAGGDREGAGDREGNLDRADTVGERSGVVGDPERQGEVPSPLHRADGPADSGPADPGPADPQLAQVPDWLPPLLPESLSALVLSWPPAHVLAGGSTRTKPSGRPAATPPRPRPAVTPAPARAAAPAAASLSGAARRRWSLAALSLLLIALVAGAAWVWARALTPGSATSPTLPVPPSTASASATPTPSATLTTASASTTATTSSPATDTAGTTAPVWTPPRATPPRVVTTSAPVSTTPPTTNTTTSTGSPSTSTTTPASTTPTATPTSSTPTATATP